MQKNGVPMGSPKPVQPASVEFQMQTAQQPTQPVYAQPAGPDASARLIAWIQEDWLLKLGALLLLIGFGWFVSYAFAHNWIGEKGRIMLGCTVGVGILIFGWFRMKKYINQGGIFLALGSTVIMLTLYAAREMYDFFTPSSVLVVMFLSASFVTLASVKYRSQPLALTSFILAGIAPLLTNSPSQDYFGLYSYLLIVIAGMVWVVVATGWRSLTVAALILFFFYSTPHLTFSSYYGSAFDRPTLLMFEYAVAAILYVTTIMAFLRNKAVKLGPDMFAAGGNGLLLLIWILAAATPEWKSLIIVAWMLVFILGAFMVFRTTGAREPFYIYAAVGLTMLASATAVQFHGHALVIAYAVECVAVALATYWVLKDVVSAERTSVLLVVPSFMSLTSIYSYAWNTSVFNSDFFVLLVMSIIYFGMGIFFRENYKMVPEKKDTRWYPTLLIIGSAYLYALIWLAVHSAMEKPDVATTFALFLYTIIGISAYFYGKFNERHIVQYYGGVLLGLVVVRLLAVDVWNMAIAGRITTFFLVGALLMGTAFIGRKHEAPRVEKVSQ